MNKIGYVIREKRIEAGLSQRKLAAETGLSINTIGNLERNVSVPEIKTVIKISDVLGLEVAELMKESAF